MRVQERNRADQDAVLAKLVDENESLRHKLETTARNLKDVRAGRKEDEAELRVVTAELQSLKADKVGLTFLSLTQLRHTANLFRRTERYTTFPLLQTGIER